MSGVEVCRHLLHALSAAQRRLGKMRVKLRTLAPSPPERPNVKNFRLVLFMLFMFNTTTLFTAQNVKQLYCSSHQFLDRLEWAYV